MSKLYNTIMYYACKALTIPSLASSVFFGNELVNNVSNYTPEQIFLCGGAAVVCGGAGIIGIFSKREHFGLEERTNSAN